jgi:hypothetical protein
MRRAAQYAVAPSGMPQCVNDAGFAAVHTPGLQNDQ